MNSPFLARCVRISVVLLVVCIAAAPPADAAGGKFVISVVDRASGKPMACRMHLFNAAGRARKAGGAPFWHDHFVFEDKIELKLPRGKYTFVMECGPEYVDRSGNFEIKDFADDSQSVDMKRFVDMAKEGWWSGDLDVRRPSKDVELLMKADDLHLAHVVTWDNKTAAAANISKNSPAPLVELKGDRVYHALAGADARGGGPLLLLGMKRPMSLTGYQAEYPSSAAPARAVKKAGGWVHAARADAWDLPLWIAHGLAGSISTADDRLGRLSVSRDTAGTRPRDALEYPGAHGAGRWAQHVYFQLLNCGLRIPPAAGSGSGVAPNPVGYNRVYVHCGERFSYRRWMEGLAAGRVVVTNGPLVRPTVEGQWPGHVFQAAAGESLELAVALNLGTRDKVEYLELIKNGEVVHEVPLRDWADNRGMLPKLTFKESGWFLVRAVTVRSKTYRYAMTGPYYVEIGGRRRVSRQAARFFHDWVFERARGLKLPDDRRRTEVIDLHRVARDFYQKLLESANAP